MPVPAEDDEKVASVEGSDIGIERLDYRIAVGHREVAAREEILLYVHHEQGVAFAKPELPGEAGSGPRAGSTGECG